MVISITGKYKLIDSDRYDEYLKSVGAGMLERELAWKFRPYLEYQFTPEGKWKQRTILGQKNCDILFVPGEEFEEHFYGTKVKSQIIFDGKNKLIHKQRVGPVEAIVTREFNGNEMTSVFQVLGDTVATRTFRKIA